ncbi:MAG: hypothetical protein ACI4PV_06240 [Butyricicoccus sp.]
MDEKERQAIEEEETALVSAEDETEEAEDEEALDEEDASEGEEEGERLYFGRFTAGVWHGGILGIALSYIALGLLGMANKRFSLGIESELQSPLVKYGLLIVLCYGLGKLGGMWEKRRKEAENAEE